jgi:hypothetical protein
MSLCRRVQLDLIPLFSADLDAAEAETVREHVAVCTACAAELAVYADQAARFAAAREGRRAPRLELWERVRADLAEPAPRGEILTLSSFTRRVGFVAAAAAIFVASIAGLRWLAPSSEVTPPAPSIAGRLPESATPSHEIAVKLGTTPGRRGERAGSVARTPRSRPRTLFQDEGAAPVRFAEDRELVPLDEESVVPAPGLGFGQVEAEPARRDPNPSKKSSRPDPESESLSF